MVRPPVRAPSSATTPAHSPTLAKRWRRIRKAGGRVAVWRCGRSRSAREQAMPGDRILFSQSADPV